VTLWFFLNSSFLGYSITLIVGLVAYYLYLRQKIDFKKDAANIILLEIQNAERSLNHVKEALREGRMPRDIFLMQTESWSKYRYLFVRSFDQNEWDTVTLFYDRCHLYDEAVKYNNTFFPKNEEQVRISLQRVVTEYLKEAYETEGEIERVKLLTKAADFINFYLRQSHLLIYDPQKPINDAKIYVENIQNNLSQTSIGQKLKKIAKIK
jgi:hypothetical protein